VLVPIVLAPDRRAGAKVLFTRRTESLPRHSGQVSFPGGAIDPEDADVVSGALREVQEEIGVDPAQVRVLGALDIYLTITGYAVAPLVGLLAPGFSLAPDAREVAEVFEVPLAFLLDRTNYRQAGGVFNGIARRWWIIEYGRHHIWGATAGILHNLVQRIDADGPKP
jgi:8-oxo-dGTP pyrophosphatase MutT (NUDIX family)